MNGAPSLMLPVQPRSVLDAFTPGTRAHSYGWGLFSGTSIACHHVPDVVALLLEQDPTLTPLRVKETLADSTREVTTGTSSPSDAASPGPETATEADLEDAKWA